MNAVAQQNDDQRTKIKSGLSGNSSIHPTRLVIEARAAGKFGLILRGIPSQSQRCVKSS